MNIYNIFIQHFTFFRWFALCEPKLKLGNKKDFAISIMLEVENYANFGSKYKSNQADLNSKYEDILLY